MLDNTQKEGEAEAEREKKVNFIVFMIATKCKKSKNQINYSNVTGILIRAEHKAGLYGRA